MMITDRTLFAFVDKCEQGSICDHHLCGYSTPLHDPFLCSSSKTSQSGLPRPKTCVQNERRLIKRDVSDVKGQGSRATELSSQNGNVGGIPGECVACESRPRRRQHR